MHCKKGVFRLIQTIKRIFTKEHARCAAIIVAAGRSNRMQGQDKIMTFLQGEPLIAHTIRVFQNSPFIDEIIVVTREDLISTLGRICHQQAFDKVTMIVPGGETRVHSVMNGLNHVSKSVRLAAIHDGARPFVTPEIIEKTVRKAESCHAAAPAVPVKDTIKTAEKRIVTGTPDRKLLFAVQTPQIFDFDLLRGALQKALDENLPITDDCSAVEAMGMSVCLTEGSDLNIKITTPTDLILAEAILKDRGEA